jgi:hypothetical protein
MKKVLSYNGYSEEQLNSIRQHIEALARSYIDTDTIVHLMNDEVECYGDRRMVREEYVIYRGYLGRVRDIARRVDGQIVDTQIGYFTPSNVVNALLSLLQDFDGNLRGVQSGRDLANVFKTEFGRKFGSLANTAVQSPAEAGA